LSQLWCNYQLSICCRRLLLQNWWPGKQLIEVSSETIVSSKVTLYFPTQKQILINPAIPTLLDKQAETFVGGSDIPEKRIPERQFLLTGSRAARL
jgi:hypothetical protein